MIKINAEDLLNYRCPRWNELPEIDLYIDQVVYILQNSLSVFSKGDTPIITASMINNYVKQNVLPAPIKKKYNRTHLAYLFVICIFKRLMSISEIGVSINIMRRIVSVEDGYNLFCEELERALRIAFYPAVEEAEAPGSLFTKDEPREVSTMKAILAAFANCVLVDRLILMRDASAIAATAEAPTNAAAATDSAGTASGAELPSDASGCENCEGASKNGRKRRKRKEK